MLRTNSGLSSLETCVRKRGRQGAGPVVEGVVAVVDMLVLVVVVMVRRRESRRVCGWDAILKDWRLR